MRQSIILPLLITAALLASAPATHAQGKDFKGQNLERRDFNGQNLEDANFTDAKLFLANLKNCKLVGARFNDADLTSASLDGADATGADFRDATLKNASLQTANLAKANLEGQDLKQTSLQSASLRGANLRKLKGLGDITKADFREADLRGAVMFGAVDYAGTSARFRGAKYDKDTRWPKGFDVEGSGAVLVESDAVTPPPVAPSAGKSEKPAKPAPPVPAEKAPAASAEKVERPAGAPTEVEVKRILESTFWAPAAQGGVKHTYNYKTLKFGKSRKGEFRTDGVPANSDTTVYPVLAICEIVRTFPDGTTKSEMKDQAFVFFKDEFERWTFRFKGNN